MFGKFLPKEGFCSILFYQKQSWQIKNEHMVKEV